MVVPPDIDFAAHAAEPGRNRGEGRVIGELEPALEAAQANARTTVIVIDTHPLIGTRSRRPLVGRGRAGSLGASEVDAAREKYEAARRHQRRFN